MRRTKKAQNGAAWTRAKRHLSHGVGAGVGRAPVGRLKKLWLKFKSRRTTNKVVGTRGAGKPVRARAATTKKVVGDRPGSVKRTVRNKTPAAKKKPKKAFAKQSRAKRKLD